MPHFSFLARYALQLTCLALLVITAGCAGKQKIKDSDDDASLRSYTPRDDGRPLSPAELKAFNSQGDMDTNLGQEEKRIVETHFKYFVHERRGTFERFLARSAVYLPHAKKIFQQRGLPPELVYLFMVESGGNPKAISPAGAAGLWQFMPYTGKKYGLSQDKWVDERLDPYKATFAASDYLLKLFGDFRNWHLAAAAYNAGEGKIGRAIDGTKATDFFELLRTDCNLEEGMRLKEETRQYVPRILAVAKIMRNLKLLGFQEPSPQAAPAVTAVTLPPSTNLKRLASTLGVSWDEFRNTNPAFRRNTSHPNASNIAYVPTVQVATVQNWLATPDARMYAAGKEHTIKKNETLAAISKKYKVSTASIQEANDFTKLPKPGTVIFIPGKETAVAQAKSSSSKAMGNAQAVAPATQYVPPVATAAPTTVQTSYAASNKSPSSGTYTVRQGDALFSLAKSWGTDMGTVMRVNNLSSPILQAGQRLIIPQGASSSQVAQAKASQPARLSSPEYTPQATPQAKPQTIAAVPQNRSVAATPAPAPKENIPTEEEPAPTAATTHNVGKGDTLYSIAKRYNMSVEQLRALNNMSPNGRIQAGQTLTTAAGQNSSAPSRARAVQPAPNAVAPSRLAQKNTGKPASAQPAKSKAAVVVKPGDTLFSIAKRHNVSVETLRKTNKIPSNNAIKQGQKLLIP